MEFFIEPIPVWAMCYLVNGDSTGLTDEDKTIVDKWWKDNKVWTVSPVSEDSGRPILISRIFLPLERHQMLWIVMLW